MNKGREGTSRLHTSHRSNRNSREQTSLPIESYVWVRLVVELKVSKFGFLHSLSGSLFFFFDERTARRRSAGRTSLCCCRCSSRSSSSSKRADQDDEVKYTFIRLVIDTSKDRPLICRVATELPSHSGRNALPPPSQLRWCSPFCSLWPGLTRVRIVPDCLDPSADHTRICSTYRANVQRHRLQTPRRSQLQTPTKRREIHHQTKTQPASQAVARSSGGPSRQAHSHAADTTIEISRYKNSCSVPVPRPYRCWLTDLSADWSVARWVGRSVSLAFVYPEPHAPRKRADRQTQGNIQSDKSPKEPATEDL